ncbi:MAG: cache domain-containing protein, partial [Anaerolineales bacterium]
MNSSQIPLPSETQWTNRNTWWLWISGLAALIFAASEFASMWMSDRRQLWAVLPVFLATPFFLWLIWSGRRRFGGVLLMAAIGVQTVLTPMVLRGPGLPNSIISLALLTGLGVATLPRRYIGRVLIAGMITLIASILIDTFGDSNRPAALFTQARWIFASVISVLFVIFFAGEFLLLDLRTKIVTSILGTGGIALAILIAFALVQAGETANSLTTRLDRSVRQFAEEQLINTVFTEANNANQEFEDIAEEAIGLAQIWSSLRGQEEALTRAPYWDASENLIQLDGGQYGNKATDPSSVFVPAGTPIDDALLADLNVSAYLDFSAPAILQERPSLLALYAIDTRGITRYYPNIDLAALLPPDFDATQRPYYSITSPFFNSKRLARWTIPYVDAAGGGLVVTVGAPVYEGDRFIGVVAADMQLAAITE